MGVGIGCGVGWGPGFGPEVIGYVGAGCGVGFSVGFTLVGFGVGLPANFLFQVPYNGTEISYNRLLFISFDNLMILMLLVYTLINTIGRLDVGLCEQ